MKAGPNTPYDSDAFIVAMYANTSSHWRPSSFSVTCATRLTKTHMANIIETLAVALKSKHAKKTSGMTRMMHIHSSVITPSIRFKALSLYPLNWKSSVFELRARKGLYTQSSQVYDSRSDRRHG